MTLAEYAIKGREYDLVTAPHNVYCFLCNLIVHKNEGVRKYDAATYTHITCPKLPHRTYAPHKY